MTTTNLLFLEQLNNSGLIKDDRPNLPALASFSPSEIIEFSRQALELTSPERCPQETGSFSHSASLSLSGHRTPCSKLDCRLNEVNRLTQFAALYSDRVFINNFMCDYLRHSHEDLPPPDQSVIKRDFAEDIAVVSSLIPFIREGIIVPIAPPSHCPRCLTAQVSLDKSDQKRLDNALVRLTRRYSQDTTATLTRLGDKYGVRVTGPESLLDHGAQGMIGTRPPKLSEFPRLAARIDAGEQLTLSKMAIKKLQIDRHLAGQVYQTVLFELACAQCLKTMYLSDRQVEIDFIRGLNPDTRTSRNSDLVERHLTCLLPFLDDLSPADLLKLRSGEQESFILFRQALDQAIAEYRKSRATLSQQDAKAIYQDIIRPKLARIDLRMRTARKSLIKRASRKAIAWTAAISFGMYAGFVPTTLIAAAGALGLTKILADLIQGLPSPGDVIDSIRTDEMYFLWKVRRAARRTM